MNFKLKPSAMRFAHIALLSMAVITGNIVHAQLNPINLIQFTEKDGLPAAEVHNVIADKLGYIWIGTKNGLTRYDGYEFKRFYFNPNDTATIHGLIVLSLFEDRKGQIWVGTNGSYLNAYDPVTKAFRQYNFKDLPGNPSHNEVDIESICADNNGRIYFGAGSWYGEELSSALLYKDENSDSIKKFISADSLNIHNVYRIRKDDTGNIWLLSYSGAFKIDTKGILSKVHFWDSVFSNTNYPTDIQSDKRNHIWIISNKLNLYEYNPATNYRKTWMHDTLHTSKEHDDLFKTIVLDKDDNIWIGTNDGVQFFNTKNGKFSVFDGGANKELAHTPVADLTFDSFGTLWVGAFTNGLIKYEDKPQLKSYAHNDADKNSLTPGWTSKIIENTDGKIWILTSGSRTFSGVNILDTRTGIIQPFSYQQVLNKTDWSTIWEKSPGEIYFSVWQHGVYTFSGKTHKITSTVLPGIPDTMIISNHLIDSRENEWICTLRSGLYKKAKGAQQYNKYDLSKVIGGNNLSMEITMLYESKKHGMWILTNDGLFLYNYVTDKIERHGYDKKAGDVFVTQDINSLYEDPQGIAWVGTWQGGLSRYDIQTQKIKTFTQEDGLPSMSIQSILGDEKNNNLWLSTFDGLSRFNVTIQQFNNFSVADGIQSQLFSDGAFLKTSGGLFVFGGSNGITIFNPDEVKQASVPPKVFLTDLKLFNKSVVPGEKSILQKSIDETKQITLAYNQDNISIDFIALHYSNPTKNRYSYKLENFDNEWRNIGNLHTAYYPNLPPGKYVFHVRAANDKGVWNMQGATLIIIVNPPWWKTIWAYCIYAICFLFISFFVNRLIRNRAIEKERMKSREIELAQAKEIEKAYHQLQSTQAQLIQSEKMASLGELTVGIAHEIQNPLNFVNNFSEVNKELVDELQTELKAGNTEEAFAISNNIKENEEKINHHGKRADSIVKGMLQHSRQTKGTKEPTDINALCDEYLRLSYHGLRAKDKNFNAVPTAIGIKTDFDESIGIINIVPQDIGRVLLNLFNNAFYATSEKQKAEGEKQNADYKPLVAVQTKKVNDKSDGYRIEITVSDNGNGIPKKIIDKIFQPFFTTKPAGQGTGLGLSLAYDIVKAHGGELKVETKAGEGSEFIIYLA